MHTSHICMIFSLNLFQDLINANIVDLYRRVLHSDSNNVIILWMKGKKSCCRWRGHESCHCLQGIKCKLTLIINHRQSHRYTSYTTKPGTLVYEYLKGHHVKQGNFSTRCWHNIRVILGKCKARNSFFGVCLAYIICHQNSAGRLP